MISAIILLSLLILVIILVNKYDHKKTFSLGAESYEVSFKGTGKSGWLETKVKRLSDGKTIRNCGNHVNKKYSETINSQHLLVDAAREAIYYFLHKEEIKKFLKDKTITKL